MSMYGRTVVDPNSIRSASVLATITTILLGLGWLLGAGWSLVVSSSRIATPHPFEDMTPIVTIPLSLGLWGGFLVAGSTWAIWQRHVALAAAPGEGVRNPDWHAQAWFASIVMWWEPLRNVRELSAYFLSPQRRWLIRHGGSPGSRSGSQGGWSSGSCGCRRLCCSWPRR